MFSSLINSSYTSIISNIEKIKVFIHNNPRTVKISKTSTFVLGAGILASIPFTDSTERGLIINVVAGTTLTLASITANYVLDIFVPPHHDMKTHVYKSGQCEGGRLFYEGDVPILSLESDDPFNAGMAQGYLCGNAINQLAKRMDLSDQLKKTRHLDSAFLDKILPEIKEKIPKKYLEEMQGLIVGYDKWAKENTWKFPKKITYDDLLKIHLIPDMASYLTPHLWGKNLKQIEENTPVTENGKVACTVVVNSYLPDGLIFARAMDWESYGIGGTYSLIINRKYTNQFLDTIEVAYPFLIGTLTGMNNQDLSIAMNLSGGITTCLRGRGMPCLLYNRACLENCKDVDEVKKFVDNSSPLGPYHLTAVDSNFAHSIHFFQTESYDVDYQIMNENHSSSKSHFSHSWSQGQPLITLNCVFRGASQSCSSDCAERKRILDQFFKLTGNRPIEEVLELPYVNNWRTTHKVIMKPRSKAMKVAFDNAFAGKAQLHSVPTDKLFT